MRAIAAASGCTTAALYPLFPSKEAIYAELLAELLLRLRDSVNASIQGVLDPRTRLTAGARAFLSYYRDRANEVALGLACATIWQWSTRQVAGPLMTTPSTRIRSAVRRAASMLL